jgi:hypothetical protein
MTMIFIKSTLKTKTRYFSVNFQVQGLKFSLIIYQFEDSSHPREADTSNVSIANLIIQDSPSKYS